MCDQVGRPLLDRRAGGRSPGYLLARSSDDAAHSLQKSSSRFDCAPIEPISFVFRRPNLRQQVRPVPSNNAAYFVIDSCYDFGAFLDLSADQFEFLGTEGAIV
jgi:hypothetical protein